MFNHLARIVGPTDPTAIGLTAIGIGNLDSYTAVTGLLGGDLTIFGSGADATTSALPDTLGGNITVQNGAVFDIAVACFLPGTLVLTDRGEVPAAEVAIGDRLVTLSGEARTVKWIGRRSCSASVVATDSHVAPVLIRAGALADNLPRRDLYLSPGHAMHLDGILVESGHLVNDLSILRAPVDEDGVDYINFEFEDHEVIFAEGVPAETGCYRGDRAVYDNAGEYAGLYPHEAQNQITPHWAPRLDCGFAVEAIRRRIDARAGLPLASDTQPGALKGWIENLDGCAIRGVAGNADTTAPAVLELVIDGAVIGQVVANHFRPARIKDGFGNGRCGFQFKLPEGLSPYLRHTVSVRRVSDKVDLVGSPFMMEASTKLTVVGRGILAAAMENAVAAAGSVEEIDRALDFMAARAEALLQAQADLAGHRAERTAPPVAPGWSKPVTRAELPEREAA